MSKLLSLSDDAARLARSLSPELGVIDLAGEIVRRRGSPALPVERPSPGLAPYPRALRCAELGRSEVVRRLGGMSSDASTGYGARRLGEGDRPREVGAGDTPRTLELDLAGETPLAAVLVAVLPVLRVGEGLRLDVGLEMERRRVGVAVAVTVEFEALDDEFVGVAGLRVGVAGRAPSGVTGRGAELCCRVGVDGRAACALGEALDEGVDERVGVAGRLVLLIAGTRWLCDLVGTVGCPAWGVLGLRLGLGFPLFTFGAGDLARGAVPTCNRAHRQALYVCSFHVSLILKDLKQGIHKFTIGVEVSVHKQHHQAPHVLFM